MSEIILLLYSFIQTILIVSVIMLASIFIHELGHLFAARKIDKSAFIKIQSVGKRLKIQTHWMSDSKQITRKIYKSGVLSGFYFILAVGVFYPYALLTVFPYLVGCQSDIKKMKEYL